MADGSRVSTGAAIVAVLIAIASIAYTYPRIVKMLMQGGGSSVDDGHRRRESRPGSAGHMPESAPQGAETRPRINLSPPGPPDMGPNPRSWPWQERILIVKDYAVFVPLALPEAQKGNADAQFALYAAFSFCRDGMMKRTAEERARIPAELWDSMHRRCDALALKYPDLASEASAWLQSALAAGFPRAIAFAAIEDIKKIERGEVRGHKARALIADVKARLIPALAANDPAITAGISTRVGTLFPAEEARAESAYWVWRLAACEQGLDCGPQAGWLHDVCRLRDNCRPGENGQQYIRRMSGDLSSLQARARDLARKLRKGEFTLEDFDQSVLSLPVPKPVKSSRPAARLSGPG